MVIRLRVRSGSGGSVPLAKPQGYPFRISSFLGSLVVHGILIESLMLISSNDDRPLRATSISLNKPEVRNVLIYDIRRDIRRKPQDVAPLKRSGLSPKPQGNEVSKQAVIATAPKAKSTEQFIWQPAPKLQIKQDLQTANLIARVAASLPAPPAPPKEKPPRPEVEGVKANQKNDSPAQSKGDLNHAPESLKAVETPKPLKAFVPPPPPQREPLLPVPVPMQDAPALEGGSAALSKLPVGAGTPVFSRGSLSAPTAPVGPVATPGNANIDIAVASLHPNDANHELPEGERPGKFAKAPIKGAPGTGEVNGSAALTVPNLTIREDKTKSVGVIPENKSNLKSTLYSEKVRSIGMSTLSVPLKPSNRAIPRAVDARFQGRNVYTMVIPIESLAAYSGDWIIWFAEKEPKTGETPLMRAPLPFRKLEPVDQVAVGGPAGERVQIMGILEKDGKLDGVTAVAKAGAVVEQAAIRDFAFWEFKPATRNGMPVTVEVVIEISLVYSPPIAKHAQP